MDIGRQMFRGGNPRMRSLVQLPIMKHLARALSPSRDLNRRLDSLQSCIRARNTASFTVANDEVVVHLPLASFAYFPRMAVIALYQEYEKASTEFVLDAVPKGAVVVDVGANYGWYSMILAKNKGCEVHAFEPISALVDLFKKNVSINGVESLVKVNKAVVGEKSGKARIVDQIDGAKRVSTRPVGSFVKSVTIDDYTKGFKRIDLIKGDIEGFELFMLRGAKKTLKKHKPALLLEIEQRHTRLFGYDPKEVFSFLEGLGYHCQYVFEGSKRRKFTSFEKSKGNNFYFV